MKSAFRFKVAGLVVLGAMILYWLSAGLAAVLAGQSRAIGTLVQMLIVGVVGFLAWKWPLPGGLALVLLGVAVAVYYLLVLHSLDQALAPLLLIAAPMALSGLLFIEADWDARKARMQG
jgi:peptidoglycan/LPS O-acetylase OafA/YrhL